MHFCRGCEAADYPCKALKNIDGSLVAMLVVRGSGGMPPGKLRFSESVSADCVHISVSTN